MEKDRMNEDMPAEFCEKSLNDPLYFVREAFNWGEGDLTGFDGPDVWQTELLSAVKNELNGAVISRSFAVHEIVIAAQGRVRLSFMAIMPCFFTLQPICGKVE